MHKTIMTERAIWRDGLSGRCAIGRAGSFLAGVGNIFFTVIEWILEEQYEFQTESD